MDITELVWKLFILLLPGVIATIMINQVSEHKKSSIFEFTVYSAVLGLSSVLIMEIFYSLWNVLVAIFTWNFHSLRWGTNLSLWDNLFGNRVEINKIEIIISYIFSIPLGVAYGYISSKKILNRLFKKWKLTNRYGDNDVWSFLCNSPEIDWIYLRDKSTQLTYFGKLRAFSDSGKKREILLQEVEVYRDENRLYDIDSVYLELDEYQFSIETPKKQNNGRDNEEQTTE
ncbi:MAG: hypothetical protein LBN24_11160 [Mediterranea sp.]|jgi:hypothetical protein|nr:hypothetical protein [Mediterranea sp.]